MANNNFINSLSLAESGGSSHAKNPRSSATGVGQFINSTWLSLIKKHKPEVAAGKTDEQLLQLRYDPNLSKELMGIYANENAGYLKSKGFAPTEGVLSLAHFAGPSGAAAILANPGQTVRATLGEEAVQANPFLKGKTNADLIEWAEKRVGTKEGKSSGVSRLAQALKQPAIQQEQRSSSLPAKSAPKTYDKQRYQGGNRLIEAGQALANTKNPNWLSALGATGLAAYGSYLKDSEEKSKQAQEQVSLERIQEAAQNAPPIVKALLQSPDPNEKQAGIQALLQASMQPQKDDKWKLSRDGATMFNEVTGETKKNPDAPPSVGLRLTKGEEAIDRKFAEDNVDFRTGGESEILKRLGQLKETKENLDSGDDSITGPVIGMMPDWLSAFVNPEAISNRERVEEVAQSNLREVLGGQFAMKEGEQLIKRAYNPALSEEENSKRVGRLIEQIKRALDAKKAAVEYFHKKGTLKGYKGPVMPSLDEIERAIEGEAVETLATKAPSRPEGKTDRQLLLEARDALANGAPEGAVKKQLEDWGVKF